MHQKRASMAYHRPLVAPIIDKKKEKERDKRPRRRGPFSFVYSGISAFDDEGDGQAID